MDPSPRRTTQSPLHPPVTVGFLPRKWAPNLARDSTGDWQLHILTTAPPGPRGRPAQHRSNLTRQRGRNAPRAGCLPPAQGQPHPPLQRADRALGSPPAWALAFSKASSPAPCSFPTRWRDRDGLRTAEIQRARLIFLSLSQSFLHKAATGLLPHQRL